MSESFISQIINSKADLGFTVVPIGIPFNAWTSTYYMNAPVGRYVFIQDSYYSQYTSWEGGFKNVNASNFYNFGNSSYAKSITSAEFFVCLW